MSRSTASDRSSRRRVLFISLQNAHFVEDDRRLLSEHFEVQSFDFDSARRSHGSLVLRAITQAFWLLRKLPRADLVFGWFVDYHMLLPAWLARAFRRPVVAVLGGFDCNTLPDLGYGVFASSWRAPLARLIFRRLTLMIPTTRALISSRNDYASYPDQHRDGVLTHIRDLKTPYRVIPLGIDVSAWPQGPDYRDPEVLTVAFLRDERTFRVKGIDVYLEVADRLPHVGFKVVGVAPEFESVIRKRYHVPDNVEMVPPQSQDKLRTFYQSASVYLQLSRTEALPNVVKEAMCCGCIPVGSEVAGIPEVIGDHGAVVETPEPDDIAEVVRRTLDGATPDRRHAARRRITEHFGQDRRREMLIETLVGLLESQSKHE